MGEVIRQIPPCETVIPDDEMTYLEQYAPAFVAELLDLCDLLD